MSEISTIAQSLLIETTYPVVLATLVHVEGSSYRRAGARRLIASDGSAIGSISGGCLENDIQERAVTLLETVNRFELVIYDTKSENDILWGTGTGCHGVVKVLLEKMDQCPSWAEKIWAAENSRQNVAINTIWEISDQETSRLGTSLAENSGSAQTGTFGQTIPPSPSCHYFWGRRRCYLRKSVDSGHRLEKQYLRSQSKFCDLRSIPDGRQGAVYSRGGGSLSIRLG